MWRVPERNTRRMTDRRESGSKGDSNFNLERTRGIWTPNQTKLANQIGRKHVGSASHVFDSGAVNETGAKLDLVLALIDILQFGSPMCDHQCVSAVSVTGQSGATHSGPTTTNEQVHGNSPKLDSEVYEITDPPSPQTLVVDPVENVKGMYRLLDLIGDSGSNGYVDKVVIAQDSLQRFINDMSPGAYASIRKVDFKSLDQLAIKPLGVYGSKDEIVRLLRTIARSLLKPTGVGDSQSSLSSGLYIVRANVTADLPDERHYVVYWPEDSTWDDSAASPVRRNRVTFMRYLTKMCDQVVALLSPEYSTSLVWNDEDSDAESIDMDTGDSDRLFTFEVAKTNEQEETRLHVLDFRIPPDCPVDPVFLVPRLLPGETAQGTLTATYIPRQVHTEIFDRRSFTEMSLKQLLRDNPLVFSEALDENAMQILLDLHIADIFPQQCNKWRDMKQDISVFLAREQANRQVTLFEELASKEDALQRVLRDAIIEDVTALFPSLERDRLSSRERSHEDANPPQDARLIRLSDLKTLYPDFQEIYQRHFQNAKFDNVLRRDSDFEAWKLRLVSVRHLLGKHRRLRPETRAELVRSLLGGDFNRAQRVLPDDKKTSSMLTKLVVTAVGALLPSPGPSSSESLKREMKVLSARISDSQFLLEIKGFEDEDLRPKIQDIEGLAHSLLSSSIDATVRAMSYSVVAMQQEVCRRSLRREIESEKMKLQNEALVAFIRELNAQSTGGEIREFTNLVQISVDHKYPCEYWITGRRDALKDHQLEFHVHLMNFTSADKQNMQLNPKYIPSPTVNERQSYCFHVSIGMEIAFCRILENEKLLLVLIDQDWVSIYLERLATIDMVIRRNRPIKAFNREKLGQDVLFAFDEAKRVLAVCVSIKLQIHMYVFDETFKTLQGQGSPVNLASWYSQAKISILQMAFVSGNEEVVLVDSSARARIFSFITLQFRPASLKLPSVPDAIFSSPDGSCLLALHNQDSKPSLTAYHWQTFGSTHGIPVDVSEFSLGGVVLTSIGSRGCIFLVSLDTNTGHIQSIAIDITKKVTEFIFKKKGSRTASNQEERHTLHNSLLDCHTEVWTRFPVVPAVKRSTVTSLGERQQKSLTFITEDHTQPFDYYFSDLIQAFVRMTRKPTGDELRRIKVSAAQFGSFKDNVITHSEWNVSRYRAGEWLVDLLCLIPIHIAVCRENRFVPLADGVLSPDLEQSLLGAEVNQIVDRLSFGWYESIFQSYLSTKPVKVVSSMGQQSVGKSYSLNHLLDTSFAGSAMRTTEGVWLSVTPTDETLIVALDFEGVDSIERSLQEDTLLVLFNTAISNLVLFRNNFAFSRDISGLFQSFQSSASVLDPAANPSLFQSTLVIIIKDVVDTDKMEITDEFSLKFQKIVEQEQGANFISRLHGGKLEIIPWPVIESKEFYKLFSTLKKRLDLQKISHVTAGEFLHTIKTLMAKLKANDWGALSQTMTEHRAKTLSTLLPIALATGYSEIEPGFEPLKNFDTDLIIEGEDTAARFVIFEHEQQLPSDIELHLAALRESWNPNTARQFMPDPDWMIDLASYISGLIDLRVNHVRLWLDSNLERFQTGHAAVQDLRRHFDNMVIEMRANVQLCGAHCASCHLHCIRSRLHEGDHSCQTTHKCLHGCGFCKEEEPKPCGTPAGHPGEHICVVNAHLCGEPCKLSGKRGCLEGCTKVAGHAEDEHLCSAPVHMCGEPCALKGMRLPGGKTYSCPESCSIPSDQDHERHACDTRLCPATCDLCKRLCVQPHLHGLALGPAMHHLCGREAHSCSALCSAPGICQIDTAPLSIEATFTGRHETFQYTKTIEPGQTSHTDAHIHSKEELPFHFCETRCENCGYFCTLPLGHTQQEHETSHGSMTQTRWAVDGAGENDIELGGRRFSSNDEGGPMMCNLVCSSMGRHIHIDYCRAEEDTPCEGAEVQHINTRMTPNHHKPKDAVTHSLYWRRMDPYTRDEQANFTKWCVLCHEHSAAADAPGQPSYCTLPLFHQPRNIHEPVEGLSYISNDGHVFECRNPVALQQAFHVIFVIDRSSSMTNSDRRPLADSPATGLIRQYADNRLGAVYSALYSFWSARHAAVMGSQQAAGARHDAYSVVLFGRQSTNVLVNDFTNTPNQLLNILLAQRPSHGTNFAEGLRAARTIMEQNWSTERTPVMIFLSDGECSISDEVIQDVCRSAVQRGKPLSFHAVSFGSDTFARPLRRMARLALEIQNNAPHDPLLPAASVIPSTFTTALDTVQLAETFLGFAESLRKPRGSLMR
ncbi:hypothetical protein BJV74DRAFT_880022 [Russula compacta]|nr:hypothetical protein BJV74DRAFT_880022 [Russula compacta]